MPRSSSRRKYKSYKERGKYHKHYDTRDERSRSRSYSHRRYNNHRHHKSNKYYDRSYTRNDRKYYIKHERSPSPDRSNYRSPSSYSPKRKYSRKHYKYDNKPKYYHHHHRKSKKSYTKSVSNFKALTKKSSDDEKDRSKDADHYRYKEGYIINDQYKIIKHLGDGTFGRVLEVEDIKTRKTYAMKVIRAVQRYVESAQTEAEILMYINQRDPQDIYKIVRLETAFLKDPSHPHKEQNYFMVFEKLGMSLYDFLKMNKYRGFSIDYVQSFARQILISIGFMHSIGLTHTDLKPENILLVNDEYEPIRFKQDFEIDDRSSTCSHSEEKIHYKPKYDNIKIIDMGGATYDHDHHSSIINTRQYRAPEVMLACFEWGHESDVWSIGCILLELFSGDLFFETHDTYEHLAMIDRACGPIPYKMGNRAESKIGKHFILEEEYFKKYKTFFDWPKFASGMQSIKRVSEMKLIEDIVPSNYPEFRDLLKRMLTIDPTLRIKCSEALQHDFFNVKYRE